MAGSSMSWPFGEKECPHCRYLHPVEPPLLDDAGYEIRGFCLHPRIATDLFIFKNRNADQIGACPCFWPRPKNTEEVV
jgi:hypothetical protein